MGRIPDEVIAEVRERTDIVAVIGEHVSLKKAGASYKGLCPFHGERTPSFHVSPAKKAYYCFGCQRSGDVFKFVTELQGKSFVEVVRELAGRCGVQIPEKPESPQEQQRRSERSRLLDVNAMVAAFWRGLLLDGEAGQRGRAYLESRGIGAEVSETFKLGLAPEAWDALAHHLESRRVPVEVALQLGLVAPRQQRGGFYDKFRDRVMCPVILPAGEIVGFSGRTLGSDPETPKYMNSPESMIYKKSHLLFGLHAARAAFHRKGRALLVEGNFDVIALHQAGFAEAVAPLGTALTAEQVDTLRRLAPTIVLCTDGDKAGRAAAFKDVPLCVAAGVETRVATLPDGEDPDSFVRKQGAAAFDALIARAQPAVDYYLDQLWFRSDRSADARARALKEAAPLLQSVHDDVKRSIIIEQFAKAMDISPQVVRGAIARGPGMAAPSGARMVDFPMGAAAAPTRPPAPRTPPPPPPPPAELKVLGILADHPELLQDAERLGVRSLLTDVRLRDMYSAALAGGSLIDAAPSEISDIVAREVFSGSNAALADPLRTLTQAVGSLRVFAIDAELKQLALMTEDAKRRGDTALERELVLRQLQTRKQKEESR